LVMVLKKVEESIILPGLFLLCVAYKAETCESFGLLVVVINNNNIGENIMSWKPSKSDIRWTENLLSLKLGSWAGDFGLLELKHDEKKYRWKSITAHDVGTAVRIDIVMKQLGWKKEKADIGIADETGAKLYYNK